LIAAENSGPRRQLFDERSIAQATGDAIGVAMYTGGLLDKGIGQYLWAALMGLMGDENRVTHVVSARGLSNGGHRRSRRARQTKACRNAY
jgi:hypothetical protein